MKDEDVQRTLSIYGPVLLDPSTCLLGNSRRHGVYAMSLVLPQLTFYGQKQHSVRPFILALAKDSSWSESNWEILEIANSQISVAISHACLLQNLQD
jgi:GAF domain-containing protein